jgi:hypothetical protein
MRRQNSSPMFLTFERTSFTCGLVSGIGSPLPRSEWSCLLLGGGHTCYGAFFFWMVLGLHCTWLVNSATHMWGSRRFQTHDNSRNSFWVAILTFGEGWHNNHHAKPQSPRHGLAWYEFDLNWYGICAMRMVGLAWDLKIPSGPVSTWKHSMLRPAEWRLHRPVTGDSPAVQRHRLRPRGIVSPESSALNAIESA